MAKSKTDPKTLKPATRLIATARDYSEHGIVSPAVYHASTILYPTYQALKERKQTYQYGRRGTPTSRAVETAIATLENGFASKVAPSGLAAITTTLLAFLNIVYQFGFDSAYLRLASDADEAGRRRLFATAFSRTFVAGISHLDISQAIARHRMWLVLGPVGLLVALVLALPFCVYDYQVLFLAEGPSGAGSGPDLILLGMWCVEWILIAFIWVMIVGYMLLAHWAISSHRYRDPIEMVLHDRQHRPFLQMSALENMMAAFVIASGRWAALSGRVYAQRLDRAMAMLETVGLADRAATRVADLSLGDRKRLEFGMALAGDPDLLLLDEPTAGMSIKERHHLMEMVAERVDAEGKTLLFVEHDIDVVMKIAQRVTVLVRGAIPGPVNGLVFVLKREA